MSTRDREFRFKDITHKLKKLKPEAVGALEQVLVLANAAQIPICGAVFSVAVELVKMVNGVSDNKAATKDLLDTIGNYSARINRLIVAVGTEYVESSEEREAVMVRDAIEGFEKKLRGTKERLESHIPTSLLAKLLTVSVVRDAMLQMSKELQTAYEDFKHDMTCIVAAYAQRSATSTALVPRSSTNDEIEILGARSVAHEDFSLLNEVDFPDPQFGTVKPFWRDAVIGEVSGKVVVVKLYNARNGGKEALVRDLKFLAENLSSRMPQIHAYCIGSTPGFISFKTGMIVGFLAHVRKLLQTLDRDTAVMEVLKLVLQMERGARFILEVSPDTGNWSIQRSVAGSVVSERGQIMLAPEVSIDPETNGFKRTPQYSAEAVGRCWLKPFNDLEFRPLRCIALAIQLEPNARQLLTLREQDLEHLKATGSPGLWLSRLWPSPLRYGRSVHIPPGARCRRLLQPGDIGFWRKSRRGHQYFKVLCNVKNNLEIKFRHLGTEFQALASKVSPHVYVHRLRTGSEAIGPHGYYLPITLTWWESIAEGPAWQYLVQHAYTLAERFSIPPQDLVMIPERTHTVTIENLPSLHELATPPTHFFVHLTADFNLAYAYWSYNEGPLLLSEVDSSIGVPYTSWSEPTGFLPLESEDLMQR